MPYIYTPVPLINCDVLHISIHVLLYCQRFYIYARILPFAGGYFSLENWEDSDREMSKKASEEGEKPNQANIYKE